VFFNVNFRLLKTIYLNLLVYYLNSLTTCFRTVYRFYVKGLKSPSLDFITLEDGTERLSRNTNIPEQKRPHDGLCFL